MATPDLSRPPALSQNKPAHNAAQTQKAGTTNWHLTNPPTSLYFHELPLI
ncbi:hypothetical protein [Kamptonema formosum]|nr:hypothetical protein [Oscillatoria sp. PCC 10802]